MLGTTRILPVVDLVRSAEGRIRNYIRHTPTERARNLETGEGHLWLKCEQLQHTGSFKVRGAFNKLLALSEQERAKGVIAASSGNHGIAVAYAAEQLGCDATIYVPRSIDQSKRERIEQFEVRIQEYGTECGHAEQRARLIGKEQGISYISPYNDFDVLSGQGTIAAELERELPDFAAIFLPVGGGGLIGSIGAYLKTVRPDIRIVGVLPANAPVMFDVVHGIAKEYGPVFDTISDGTAGTIEAGSITIDLCRAVVDEWILVEEHEIRTSMKVLMCEEQWIVEGAAALAMAGYLRERERYADFNTVVVLCGRNIDMPLFMQATKLSE